MRVQKNISFILKTLQHILTIKFMQILTFCNFIRDDTHFLHICCKNTHFLKKMT